MKAKRLNTLEKQTRPKTKQSDILEGIDSFKDILNQINPEEKYPRDVYKMIREAQSQRIDSIENSDLLRYQNDHATLTIPEKNFVIIHEEDIKGGILRESAAETIERIRERLQEQQNDD